MSEAPISFITNDSAKFFSNTACQYYPCHKMEKLNCLFCYCPLYFVKCPGNYARLADGRKDCMECTINHEPKFWDTVQAVMKNPQPEDFRNMIPFGH